ncbi:MAG: MBL fold metallo-hydrolase [Acidobacteriota bacterium]|nr:MBL fold metallo-hydrolase [Acidobacteriota bacterium]
MGVEVEVKQATAPSKAAGEPREATSITRQTNASILRQLPFDDVQAFDDVRRGFMAPLADGGVIKNDRGQPIYDLSQFSFLREGAPAPDTVNPSLWRQAQLIMKGGLFEVTRGIYQVRAADLSNISFIEGEDGLVVVDPLISAETAKASLDLYYANRPEKLPVVAVIYSHSHVDHFGGVRGIVSEEEVKSGRVKVLAPDQFLEHASSEFVYAGNAMSRRASYMYGTLLPAGPKGQVGAGLGPTTSVGTITLIPPTDIIKENGEKRRLAGLTFEFWMAPNSEAPSEMFFYIPEKKALCTAEDATHTLHNTYTLRGAKIRDPLAWSKYLNAAIHRWGGEAEVLYAPHHWPVWGSDRIVEHLKNHRDTYRYIHDQAVRLLNHGYTMIEIAEMLELPESLANVWSTRGYYGSFNHDVKSTYVSYLGWFDGNPATLHPLSPVEASKRYVEFMGGAEAVLNKAMAYFDKGEYRWVAQVVNHVVFAEPQNQVARNLQADALEQLGFQAESGPWRNFYLTGARELREGVPKLPSVSTASPDAIRAMSLELLIDWIGTRIIGPKAAGKTITLNVKFTDTGEECVIRLENGALNSVMGKQAERSDATITLTHEILEEALLGRISPLMAITTGKIRVEGSVSKITELASLLDTFDFWFNIVTPNAA